MSFRYATKGNGTSTYGTVTVWTASRWEIEFDIVFPAVIPSVSQYCLDSDNGSVNRLMLAITATTGKVSFSATNGTAVATLDGVVLSSNVTTHPTDGALHKIKITGSFVIALTQILRRGNGTGYFDGAIFNLSLKDLDNPANDRFYPMDEDSSTSTFVDALNGQNGTWYSRTSANLIYLDTGTPSTDLAVIDSYLSLDSTQYAQAPIGATRLATKGNGTNIYGTIPTWTASNWEIEFDVVFPTTAADVTTPVILDCDVAGTNRLAFYTAPTTGYISFIGVTGTATMDGSVILSGAVTRPADGAVHSIKLTGSSLINIRTVLTRYNIANYASSSIFNLRLTDKTTPANSRFYPMDEDSSTSKFQETLVGAVTILPQFSYWQDVGGAATINGEPVSTAAGSTAKFNSSSILTVPVGNMLRINMVAGAIKIDHTVTLVLDVLSGTATDVYGDVSDGAAMSEAFTADSITMSGFRPAVKADDATYKFIDFQNNSAGPLQIRIRSITQTSSGTWFNRVSGNVVTVYPEAIKPTEEFFVAIKFEVTDSTSNSGFNNQFSLSNAAGTTVIRAYNPESNKGFGVSYYNSNVKVDEMFSIPAGRTTQADGEHIIVYKFKADGSDDRHWSGGTLTNNIAGVARDRALSHINLNGKLTAVGSANSAPASNVHYFYIYDALSPEDITALIAGENPEYVGDIRQGYNLAGDGDEVNGGPALTLYGAFDGEQWYVPYTGRRPLMGRLVMRSDAKRLLVSSKLKVGLGSRRIKL